MPTDDPTVPPDDGRPRGAGPAVPPSSSFGSGGASPIDAIIRFALSRRLLVIAGAIGLIVWGARVSTEMPVDVFPDLSAPTVTVVVEAHGMAPEEVEALVTIPVETAVNGATGVRRVRSNTAVGVSVINVEFEWGTDIYQARQIVGEKLQLVQPNLPPDLPPPILAPVSSIMGEVMFIGLSSDTIDPMELRTLADWDLKRRLQAVPGVSNVTVIGGDVRQLQVELEPQHLLDYDIHIDDVIHAVEETSTSTSPGFYTEAGREYLVYGRGRVRRPDEVSTTPVEVRGKIPVQVGDLGEVHVGAELRRGEGSINARRGVVLGIQKQPDENTLRLTAELHRALDDLEGSLPEGVELHRDLFQQADFIDTAVDNVSSALRDGAILVIIIVSLFLASWRASLITAMAIPLSLLAAVITLDLLGYTLNTMTLGGMAIAVGALVDDAIIDVENVARRLRERLGVEGAAAIPRIVFEASREVRGSIVFATMIIILVFLPLFFLHGLEGRLLEPLGVAYIVSLAASLVVALTVTPVLCAYLLPRARATLRAEEPWLIRVLNGMYRPAIRRLVRHWVPLALGSALALAVAVYALTQAGRTFLPEFNEGALTISVVSQPGTSLEASDEVAREVERVLLSHDEVLSTARRTGRASGDEHALDVNASEIEVRLQPSARGEAAFLQELRTQFDAIDGVNIIIGQPLSHRIDHMISGTRTSLAIKVFGPDLRTLRQIAGQVEAGMAEIDGVVDLAQEQQVDIPMLKIRFDRQEMSRYGLTVHHIGEHLETMFQGKVVAQLLDIDGRAWNLVVRIDPSQLEDLATIKEITMRTPTGAWVPLEAVVDLDRDLGPNRIGRENGERRMIVMANVSGRDMSAVVDDIQATTRALDLPTGYRIEVGGQFEAAEKAAERLLWLTIVVVIGILVLLAVALGTLRDALLVMLNLPLALIGGVVGVYITGTLSIASIIGFIALFGIATRNGIIVVSHVQHLRTQYPQRSGLELVVDAATERLAPVLMTALASGLGLLPLAMAMGHPGSEIEAPMAIVMLCGLATSTLLNMVLVPALYLRFGSATRPVAA